MAGGGPGFRGFFGTRLATAQRGLKVGSGKARGKLKPQGQVQARLEEIALRHSEEEILTLMGAPLYSS